MAWSYYIVKCHFLSIGQKLPTQFLICREISASVVSLSMIYVLSPVIHHVVAIKTSLTHNTYFGWFKIIKKNSVGGHVGRDAWIRKSGTPNPSPPLDLPGTCNLTGCRGLCVRNLELRCMLQLTKNAGGCWYVFVFDSKAVCLNLQNKPLLFFTYIFWFSFGFFMIFPNDAQYEIILRE